MDLNKLNSITQLFLAAIVILPLAFSVFKMNERINEVYANDQTRAIRAVERGVCQAVATDAAPAILEMSYKKYRDVTGHDYNLRAMDPKTKCAILGVDCVICGEVGE